MFVDTESSAPVSHTLKNNGKNHRYSRILDSELSIKHLLLFQITSLPKKVSA